MKLKNSLYNLFVITALVVVMGTTGYFNLSFIIKTHLKENLHKEADNIEVIVNNTKDKNIIQDKIDKLALTPYDYSWIIDNKGNFIYYPQNLSTFFKETDHKKVNPQIYKGNILSFTLGNGPDERVIYSQKLLSGNYVVVSKSKVSLNYILNSYKIYTFYLGLILIIISFFVSFLLSQKVFKPFYKLVRYAQNLLLGEYVEDIKEFKDKDTAMIASVIERYYSLSQEEKFKGKNPLSGLPGNKALYDSLFKCIESGNKFAVGFVDTNNFSAYINKYGPDKGSSLIRFMGVTVLNAMTEYGNHNDKSYHIGGDRFIFITTPDKVKNICEKIIYNYDQQIKFFYDETAQKNGYIRSTNREGKTDKFIIMPICIGVATNIQRSLYHPIQIGHIIGEIRGYLKTRKRSDFLIDRRAYEREDEIIGEKAPFSKEEVEEVRIKIKEEKTSN